MAETVAGDAVPRMPTIYWQLVRARVRSEWQYRTAFVVTTLLQLAMTGVGFAGVAVIFYNVPRLAGWSFAETALLYGMASTSFNLADTFISQVETAETHIRAGTLDAFLVRPLSPLVQLCGHEFAYRRLNKIAQAVVVLCLAAVAVDVSWTPGRLGVLASSIATGAVIYGALWVMYCSVAFWTVSSADFVYAAVTAGQVAGEYPLDVYKPWLQRALVGGVPIAFAAYAPAAWLLGRPSVAPLIGAPLVAVALTAAAATIWRAGLRQYRGTGS